MKKFTCTHLNPSIPCTFSISGTEDKVVHESTDHEINEHGYQDSPGLRQQILDLMEDIPDND